MSPLLIAGLAGAASLVAGALRVPGGDGVALVAGMAALAVQSLTASARTPEH